MVYTGFHSWHCKWFINAVGQLSRPSITDFIVSMWGSLTMVVAAITNYAGLMVLRLLLGTFEAGKRNMMCIDP